MSNTVFTFMMCSHWSDKHHDCTLNCNRINTINKILLQFSVMPACYGMQFPSAVDTVSIDLSIENSVLASPYNTGQNKRDHH